MSDHDESTWRTSFRTATEVTTDFEQAHFLRENIQLCPIEGKALNQQVASATGAYHKQGHRAGQRMQLSQCEVLFGS